MSAGTVGVLDAIDGLLNLTRHRVGIKTGAVERTSLRGRDPYHDNLKLQRAEYLLEQGEQARVAVAELIEAAELVSDTASTEWQGANGVRMGATGSDGNRLHFVSAHVMENLRAALAAMGGKA